MDEIMNYKSMAAEAAVKAMNEDCTDEERKKYLALMDNYNQQYQSLLAAEHDYNNPVRERKERTTDILKSIVPGAISFLGNIAGALVFAWVDTRDDSIPGFGTKEWFKSHIKR